MQAGSSESVQLPVCSFFATKEYPWNLWLPQIPNLQNSMWLFIFFPKLPQLKQLTGRAVKPFMVLPFYFNDKVFYEPVSCVMVNVWFPKSVIIYWWCLSNYWSTVCLKTFIYIETSSLHFSPPCHFCSVLHLQGKLPFYLSFRIVSKLCVLCFTYFNLFYLFLFHEVACS